MPEQLPLFEASRPAGKVRAESVADRLSVVPARPGSGLPEVFGEHFERLWLPRIGPSSFVAARALGRFAAHGHVEVSLVLLGRQIGVLSLAKMRQVVARMATFGVVRLGPDGTLEIEAGRDAGS